ncbi:hypothetical protein MKX01_022970 [Papaver californicum]|nr:hypothetical protein MKX01_022970 [Papaver californicum]
MNFELLNNLCLLISSIYPCEHGAYPKTKKKKKKTPLKTNDGEPKPQRYSKRLKTAA